MFNDSFKPNKRKSDASESAPSKKARVTKDEHHKAKELVKAILTGDIEEAVGSNLDEIHEHFVTLANYVKSLENQAQTGGKAPAKAKTAEQLAADAERVRVAAARGIKSQMKVRDYVFQSIRNVY